MESIYIKDANVLFDLHAAGLLGAWFNLGHRTVTTSLVCLKLKSIPQQDLTTLEIADVDEADMAAVVALAVQYRISVPDSSVLWLARENSAILVSGDRRLREAASAEGIQVRGTLWILDHLIETTSITKEAAVAALQAIRADGTFLPHDECQSRLKIWGHKSESEDEGKS